MALTSSHLHDGSMPNTPLLDDDRAPLRPRWGNGQAALATAGFVGLLLCGAVLPILWIVWVMVDLVRDHVP